MKLSLQLKHNLFFKADIFTEDVCQKNNARRKDTFAEVLGPIKVYK